MIEASLKLQTAFRRYRQQKAYKELYEKRKWTLHKEGAVLTDHVRLQTLFPYSDNTDSPWTRSPRLVRLDGLEDVLPLGGSVLWA